MAQPSSLFISFTDKNRLRVGTEGRHEDIRVGGDDQLGPARRVHQKLGHSWENIWVQADLRLFETNEWWRRGMTQHCEKAQIPQGAIRQPGAWYLL